MMLGPCVLVVLWTIIGIDAVFNSFGLGTDSTITLFFVGLTAPFVTIGVPLLLENYRPTQIALAVSLIASSLPLFVYVFEHLNLQTKIENIRSKVNFIGSKPQGYSLYRDDRPAASANQSRFGQAPEPTYRWDRSADRAPTISSSHSIDPDNEIRVLQTKLEAAESESYIGRILFCTLWALTSGLVLVLVNRKQPPAKVP
jgi:hypothetical protein